MRLSSKAFRMKISALRYVVALSKEKHFGRAAARCNVSQPTLSVAVSKLESTLGVYLFERFHHEVQITDIGEKVVAQAVIALEELDKIQLMAQRALSQLSGSLRIGAIYTVAPYLFPRLIPKLQKIAPDMPLIISEAYTKELGEKLRHGEIDIAVVALPFGGKSIVTRAIYRESFVCLLPRGHSLAKEESVDERALADERVLLLSDGHCFRSQVLSACPSCHNQHNQTQQVEGTSVETLKQMVASGLGVTVLPSSAASIPHLNKMVIAKPFKGRPPSREVALAWRVSFPRLTVIDALVKALKQVGLERGLLELS